jgi:hypothetical protein
MPVKMQATERKRTTPTARAASDRRPKKTAASDSNGKRSSKDGDTTKSPLDAKISRRKVLGLGAAVGGAAAAGLALGGLAKMESGSSADATTAPSATSAPGESAPPAQSPNFVPNPEVGQRFVLLDSVRDASFLNASSTDGLGNEIPDMGLGVVDNGLFLYTTKFTPGKPTVPRPYPVKFFWIGSPTGTTDANDAFSLFVADVQQDAFSPGALPSVWLTNQRLVLSVQQAKNDIVAWFNSNYPALAMGGKGMSGTGSNQSYGALDGDDSNPGDVSGIDSIDGQVWPVYDNVDNSIVLYFSFKTPNENTKSIYCYKATDTELTTPLQSSDFLGGAYQTWAGSTYSAAVGGEFGGSRTFRGLTNSSHRFSIISPDPLVTTARVSGQQSAVLAYAYGTFDTTTADHARFLQFAVIPDIHKNPLNWNNPTVTAVGNGGGVDVAAQYNPDKLGNIFAVPQGNQNSACYALVYNSTSDRDIRSGSNKVVVNGMQLRIAYFHAAANVVGFGDNLLFAGDMGVIGHCRGQFTTFPDGLPKIIYNNFAFDQSLQTAYVYVDGSIVRPESQRRIVISEDSFNSISQVSSNSNKWFFSTFGKKKMYTRLYFGAFGSNTASPGAQNDPLRAAVMQLIPYDGNFDFSTGDYYLDGVDEGTLILGTQDAGFGLDGSAPSVGNSGKAFEFSASDLPAYIGMLVKSIGNTGTPIYGVIVLED